MSHLIPTDRGQRVRLAAIPVLALVLYWVVTGREESAPPPVSLADGHVPPTPGHRQSASRLRSAAAWPEFSLPEILSHDPFAVPAALGRPAVVETAAEVHETEPVSAAASTREHDRARVRLELLSQKRVSVIYRGPGGPAAVIDGKEYREGDELAEGVRIVEIQPDGVFIEVPEPH